MSLFEYLKAECIETGASLSDKDAALQAVARCARECPAFAALDEATILEGLRNREALGSTGFGNGIAIPHCRLAGISEFAVGLITVPDGVAFDALDNEPVKLLCFIIAPEDACDRHIRVLSALSQVLAQADAVAEILKATTPEMARESLLRHCRDEVRTKGHEGKRLFHVFVQNEDVFRDIVTVFSTMEAASVMVVDSQNSGQFLAKMPLFADFWSDSPEQFARVIIAVVDKAMTNETIRQIEHVVGPLDKCEDVLLTVQDIFYAAGHLRW